METVSFTDMKSGSREDYLLLDRLEQAHVATLPGRILEALQRLQGGLAGYRIDRLEHSLQTATRAELDGADSQWIVAALVHDIGDDLAPMNHSEFAAALLKPYVRDEVHWVIAHHGLFQMAYYAHHLGKTRTHGSDTKTTPITTVACDFASSGIKPPSIPTFPHNLYRTLNPC